MAYSAASPVADAVFGILTLDSTLAGLVPGGVHDDVPQRTEYPFVWYEIFSEKDERGLGTGGLPYVEIRTHVYSQFSGKFEAQEANRVIIGLLKDVALSVNGYDMCGHVFYRESVTLPTEEINGVPVVEVVSIFHAYVREP